MPAPLQDLHWSSTYSFFSSSSLLRDLCGNDVLAGETVVRGLLTLRHQEHFREEWRLQPPCNRSRAGMIDVAQEPGASTMDGLSTTEARIAAGRGCRTRGPSGASGWGPGSVGGRPRGSSTARRRRATSSGRAGRSCRNRGSGTGAGGKPRQATRASQTRTGIRARSAAGRGEPGDQADQREEWVRHQAPVLLGDHRRPRERRGRSPRRVEFGIVRRVGCSRLKGRCSPGPDGRGGRTTGRPSIVRDTPGPIQGEFRAA